MTFLAIVGAIAVSIIALRPFYNLLGFYSMSDYGFIDTTKWNWKKEKLWVEWILMPVFAILWWLLVGQYISVGFS